MADVIEISDAVVRQASDFFQYERCEASASEACANGETFVTDGLAFLAQTSLPPAARDGYDLFLIDVYTGWNPVAFYAQEVMQRVRDQWLRSPASVLVVNFVGLLKGPHAVVPKSIFRTLQSVFAHVKCFRCVSLWVCLGGFVSRTGADSGLVSLGVGRWTIWTPTTLRTLYSLRRTSRSRSTSRPRESTATRTTTRTFTCVRQLRLGRVACIVD